MKTKSILIQKSSGFNYSLTVSIIDTPKGKIRTLNIIDHEVSMTDLEPCSEMLITFNSKSIDNNYNEDQLKELCQFILKGLT